MSAPRNGGSTPETIKATATKSGYVTPAKRSLDGDRLDFEALLLEEGARSFVLTYTSFIGRVFAEMNAYDRATKLPVRPWVIGELCDHIYPTCPAVARTGRLDAKDGKWWLGRYETVDDPDNILYLDPESNPHGDICGWCFRVWQSRVRRTEAAA